MFGVMALMAQATPEIVAHMGLLLTFWARELHRPHIRSGATFDSIGPSEDGLHQTAPGRWSVDIGPETLQGRLLEFGFLNVLSGKFIQYPFMIPAADQVAPIFFEAMAAMARLGAEGFSLSPELVGQSAADVVSRLRGSLYSFSKFAGDIKVFGFGGLAGFRTVGLAAAQSLGDVESAMRGAIGRRIVVRASGRWVSGQIQAQRTAIISGPSSGFNASAQRIFNRVSGRVIGSGLGSL